MKPIDEKKKKLIKKINEVESNKFTGKVIIDYYEGRPVQLEERYYKKKKL